MTQVLEGYEARRSVEVLKIQNAARNSTEWFENVQRYSGMEIEQFTYSLLTRSQRITDFVHSQSSAKIGLQLGHSGPKGSTQLGWEATDEPLVSGNWPLLAASAVAYGAQNQLPKAMTRAAMDTLRQQFVESTQRALDAGFDWLTRLGRCIRLPNSKKWLIGQNPTGVAVINCTVRSPSKIRPIIRH